MSQHVKTLQGLSKIKPGSASTSHHRHSRQLLSLFQSQHPFSSSSSRRKIDPEKHLNSNKPPNSQPFVTHRLRPGQSNPLSKIFPNKQIKSDPIYRPPWQDQTHKANIISAEDFANRPRASFEEEFESMHDAMVTLSWLTEKQRQDVYSMYIDIIIQQDADFGVTSHEYTMRLIAEKFNLASSRVAAIVQNCHDEEQLAKNDPGVLNEKLVEYVDAKIKEHIDYVYDAYGEINPNGTYIEEPTEVAGIQWNSGKIASVEDLYNVDELTQKAILRERDDAQLEIDGKIYTEDANLNYVECKVNKECIELIERNNEEFESMVQMRNKDDELEYPMPTPKESDEDDDEDNEEGEGNADDNTTSHPRRPRWKYVAQVINVRDEKKQQVQGPIKRKKNKKQKKDNTIVEEDGVLRVATVQEIGQSAWKAVRDEDEFTYRRVKDAWLRRKLEGEKYGWGRVPENIKAAARAKLEEEQKKDRDGETEGEAETEEGEESSTDESSGDDDENNK